MTNISIKARLLQLPPLWVAVIASCVLSLISILQNPILNDDAYGYLRAAELFASGNAADIFSQYGWYSYSVMIAALDPVLPGGLVASAHVLNTLLLALLVGAFVAVCRELQPGPRIPWLAALTILAFPMLNEMRYMLIRDFGFVAFSLWSLLFLVRYQATGRWRDGICWSAALLVAMAFRLEALLLVALAPLALLRTPGRIAVLYGMLLGWFVAFAAASTLLHLDLIGLMQFAYRYYLPRLTELGAVLSTNADALGTTLFTPENFPGSDNTAHSLVILLFAYGYSVVINLVQALSVPVSLVLLHAAWRGWLRLSVSGRTPLLLYIGCSTLALLLFISIMHFLTQRYATLLSLLLLLLVPGVLNRWYELARTRDKIQRFRLIAGFFCLYFFVDSLISFGHSRHYLQEAAAWTQSNVPATSELLTNDYYLAYESGRVEQYDKVKLPLAEILGKATPDTALVLLVKARDSSSRALLDANAHLSPVQTFANSRGDEVRIYTVR